MPNRQNGRPRGTPRRTTQICFLLHSENLRMMPQPLHIFEIPPQKVGFFAYFLASLSDAPRRELIFFVFYAHHPACITRVITAAAAGPYIRPAAWHHRHEALQRCSAASRPTAWPTQPPAALPPASRQQLQQLPPMMPPPPFSETVLRAWLQGHAIY